MRLDLLAAQLVYAAKMRSASLKSKTPLRLQGAGLVRWNYKKTSLEASRVHDGILSLILIFVLYGNH